jgi:glycosyltransferase involved in cell wall biosynthesis
VGNLLVCNTRNLSSNLTGVQRYTSEILSYSAAMFEEVKPQCKLGGMTSHAWEQFFLPTQLNGRLLWSPSNTGPLSVEKQVVSIMDMSPLDNPSWSSQKFSTWYSFLIPRLVKRVRHILTISEFSKSRILHYCPDAADKISVTSLAADERFNPSSSHQVDVVISQLNLPSKYYIIALGSLEPRKNIQRLINVWSNVQSKIPSEVWLIIAGAKGNKMVFGNHNYDELPPRVYLTGHVPDAMLPALYSGALASVYLSYYEGFGLPALEAMSCGTPVLVSNVASLPEVVGDAGLLVNPYDDDAIGHSIISLIEDSDLRNVLRVRGLIRANNFSWSKTAQQTMQILNKASNL